MTLAERAQAFNDAYSKWPASHLRVVQEQGHDVLYGRWVLGNNYKAKTEFYGSYPPGYLPRVAVLFPDIEPISVSDGRLTTLHVFSGSLPEGTYVRCDLLQPAELQMDVRLLEPSRDGRYDLIVADTPYSAEDAKRYGTAMPARGHVMRALARVARPSAFLVWLDTCWPMHRKAEWSTVGRIAITRSTNHRIRDLTIFQRVG